MICNTIVISVMCTKQFFHDQTRCACTSHSKINKRINRAKYVATNTPAIFEQVSFFDKLKLHVVSAMKTLVMGINDTVDEKTMIYYLKNNNLKILNNGDMIVFDLPADIVDASKCKNISHNWIFFCFKSILTKPLILNDYIKKAVESILTANLSNFNDMYYITCNFFKRIIAHMFGSLDEDLLKLIYYINNNDIIFELKGGMSSKMLMKITTNNTEEIEKVFSNGDNDTSILINPQLSNFKEIHKLICTRLHDSMKSLTNDFFSELVNHVKQIEDNGLVIGKDKFPLKHTPVSGFYGFDNDDKHILIYDEARPLKVQRNELRIFDQVSCLHHFELLRLKMPFRCLNRIICGELLDISIPYQDECVLADVFDGRNQMIPVDWINLYRS